MSAEISSVLCFFPPAGRLKFISLSKMAATGLGSDTEWRNDAIGQEELGEWWRVRDGIAVRFDWSATMNLPWVTSVILRYYSTTPPISVWKLKEPHLVFVLTYDLVVLHKTSTMRRVKSAIVIHSLTMLTIQQYRNLLTYYCILFT